MSNAKNIAQAAINYYIDQGCPITNMQLQSILYLTWCKYFAQTGTYLFSDNFEAWPFGPVLPRVYYDFYGNGANAILEHRFVQISDVQIWQFYDILPLFENVSLAFLADYIQRPGGAWDQTYQGGYGRAQVISFHDIKMCELLVNYKPEVIMLPRQSLRHRSMLHKTQNISLAYS